jgi:hypothetical protein
LKADDTAKFTTDTILYFLSSGFINDIIFIAGYGENYQLSLKVGERNKAAREAEEDGDLNKAFRFY